MFHEIKQGDILSVERIQNRLLVVSKNYFNQTEQVIVCPILQKSSDDPLHIEFCTPEMQGSVMCEQLKLLDLRVRGYKKVSELRMEDVMNIADAVQSIFDYYPFGK